jgi:hypothetical protein
MPQTRRRETRRGRKRTRFGARAFAQPSSYPSTHPTHSEVLVAYSLAYVGSKGQPKEEEEDSEGESKGTRCSQRTHVATHTPTPGRTSNTHSPVASGSSEERHGTKRGKRRGGEGLAAKDHATPTRSKTALSLLKRLETLALPTPATPELLDADVGHGRNKRQSKSKLATTVQGPFPRHYRLKMGARFNWFTNREAQLPVPMAASMVRFYSF